MTLGKFPDLRLAVARQWRNKLNEVVAEGGDIKKALQRLQNPNISDKPTIQECYLEWLPIFKVRNDPKQVVRCEGIFKNHILPFIGEVPVDQIKPKMIRDEVIERIKSAGSYDIARRACGYLDRLLNRAVESEYIQANPMSRDFRSVNVPELSQKKQPALPCELIPAFLQHMEKFKIKPLTLLLMKFLLHTGVRCSDAVGATWSEFSKTVNDLDIWTIPAGRITKADKEFVVPLSLEAVGIIADIKKYLVDNPHLNEDGGHVFVFPSSAKTKKQKASHMNPESVNTALNRHGYQGKQCAHGFRTLLSTTMNNYGSYFEEVEAALGHRLGGKVSQSYNRGTKFDLRVGLMREWSQIIVTATNTPIDETITAKEHWQNILKKVKNREKKGGLCLTQKQQTKSHPA